MDFYELSPEEFPSLDLNVMRGEDLKELSYYLWCCYDDHKALMAWRESILLPLIDQVCGDGGLEDIND